MDHMAKMCNILIKKTLLLHLQDIGDFIPFEPGLDVDRWGCAGASSQARCWLWCSSLCQKAPAVEKSTDFPSGHILPSLLHCPEWGHDAPGWQPHCQTGGHIPLWSHAQLKTKLNEQIQLWTRSELHPTGPAPRSTVVSDVALCLQMTILSIWEYCMLQTVLWLIEHFMRHTPVWHNMKQTYTELYLFFK